MKKMIVFLLLIASLIALSACGGKEEKAVSTADTYIEMAQEFIEKNDYESAISVLQKGLDATGDDRLSELMKTAIEKQIEQETQEASADNATEKEATDSSSIEDSTTTASIDLSPYFGTWAEDGIDWLYDSLVLDIYLEKEHVFCDLTYTQGAPTSRIANTTITIDDSAIEDGVFAAQFADDGWGNAGTVELQFQEAEITVIFSNIVNKDNATPHWGFYESTFTLKKDDKAHDKLSYTTDMYNERTQTATTAPTTVEAVTIYIVYSPVVGEVYCTDPDDLSTGFSDLPSYIEANGITNYTIVDLTSETVTEDDFNPFDYIGQWNGGDLQITVDYSCITVKGSSVSPAYKTAFFEYLVAYSDFSGNSFSLYFEDGWGSGILHVIFEEGYIYAYVTDYTIGGDWGFFGEEFYLYRS